MEIKKGDTLISGIIYYYNDYDELLETAVCPVCGHEGLDANGSFGYSCPNCDHEGSLDEVFPADEEE